MLSQKVFAVGAGLLITSKNALGICPGDVGAWN